MQPPRSFTMPTTAPMSISAQAHLEAAANAASVISETNRPISPGGTATPDAMPVAGPERAPEAAEDLASLSAFERWKRALIALRKVVTNPDDTKQVLVFTSVLNAGPSSKVRLD